MRTKHVIAALAGRCAAVGGELRRHQRRSRRGDEPGPDGRPALLKGKADVNAPQADGATATALGRAPRGRGADRRTAAAGAKVTIANREGATPFYLASIAGNPVILDKLLKQGVDVERHRAAARRNPVDVCRAHRPSRAGEAAARSRRQG